MPRLTKAGILLVLFIMFAACGGSTEEENQQPPSNLQEQVEDADNTSTPDQTTMADYASCDGTFHMLYPQDWYVKEYQNGPTISFSIAENSDLLDSRPDFSRPVLIAVGIISQIPPEAAASGIEFLHANMYSREDGVFQYVQVGEPNISIAESSSSFYIVQAESVEEDGSIIHWQLGTILTDLTVVHIGVGVSAAGIEEYRQIGIEMFNSVQIDGDVTGQLAGELLGQ